MTSRFFWLYANCCFVGTVVATCIVSCFDASCSFFIFCIYFFSYADHFSECVEMHAFETYDKFLKEKGGIIEIYVITI